MDRKPLKDALRNIDVRLGHVEQILPTLTTKEQLRDAVAVLATKGELRDAVALLGTKEELREAVAVLATKEELREAVAVLATKEELREAVAVLATKEELREAVAVLASKAELREEGEHTRRHFDVVAERLEGHIRLMGEVHDTHFAQLDRRVTRLESKRR